MGLRGNTVLVTGASGFIGGRLVEKLILEQGCQVRALVRDFRHTAWLSRTNAEVFYGDLNDLQVLEKAMQGCTLVFHCAAEVSSDYEKAYKTNVLGTENMLKVAFKAGALRVVHVSTVAVHKYYPDGPINEDSPFIDKEGDVYARTKLAGEQFARQFAQERQYPVAILRPTIVFGPRAQFWTVDFINRLKLDQIALPNRRCIGINNFVYVDEVVTAILLAAEAPIAPGEAFIIGGARSLSWEEYLNQYAQMLGKSIPHWPVWALKISAVSFRFLDGTIEALRKSSHSWKRPAIFLLRGVRRVVKPLRKLGVWELNYYQQHFEFKIDRARERLGYQPTTDLTEIFQDTETWLYNQGFLPKDFEKQVSLN